MLRFVLLFILCNIITSTEAVSCECDFAHCPVVDNTSCKRGVTQDVCGCCTICAGDVGEHCGGPWGLFGNCGEGLECKQGRCPDTVNEVQCYMYHLTEPGTCIEKKHHNLIDMLQGTQLTEQSNSVHDRRLRLIRELENTIKK
ncbi:UNVERIFIED_CONTAM: hypothetical protein RMT77_010479 [Armadillidium vulgare]